LSAACVRGPLQRFPQGAACPARSDPAGSLPGGRAEAGSRPKPCCSSMRVVRSARFDQSRRSETGASGKLAAAVPLDAEHLAVALVVSGGQATVRRRTRRHDSARLTHLGTAPCTRRCADWPAGGQLRRARRTRRASRIEGSPSRGRRSPRIARAEALATFPCSSRPKPVFARDSEGAGACRSGFRACQLPSDCARGCW
jgi:hypothetical protein